jgi:hypothetical protein
MILPQVHLGAPNWTARLTASLPSNANRLLDVHPEPIKARTALFDGHFCLHLSEQPFSGRPDCILSPVATLPRLGRHACPQYLALLLNRTHPRSVSELHP